VDIYQVAKNCRTSVEMMEKHHAVHLKNTLDAWAIKMKRRRGECPSAGIGVLCLPGAMTVASIDERFITPS